jgi:hypothetical protein
MLTLLNNIVWNVTFLAAVPVDCALVGWHSPVLMTDSIRIPWRWYKMES